MKDDILSPSSLRGDRGYHRGSRTNETLADPAARDVIERVAPRLAGSARYLGPYATMAIGQLAHYSGLPTGDAEQLWTQLAAVPLPGTDNAQRIAPDPGYETTATPEASATVTPAAIGRQNEPYEIRITGPSHGNPFVDVELAATFRHRSEEVTVGGFYDGDGIYVVRFLPPQAGAWTFSIESTARSLNGLHGAFEVSATRRPGLVRVVDGVHFAFDNGRPFIPIGTTAYAWTHQAATIEDETLRTLAEQPFTKLRMCVFPKAYEFNHNDPALYAYQRAGDGSWDFTRFNPEFFRHLEQRIRQLDELGIQADLILFHPYDRWGFAEMGEASDDRYVRYLVRRLAAFPNVWWSLANEWDFVWSKDAADWERIGQIIHQEDHAGHLTSIHNGVEFLDYSKAWISHASIQAIEPYHADDVSAWRARWNKPVIIDEAGYEGDIELEWGNLTARELVHRFWGATVAGAYFTHGETYWNEAEQLWWAKGGRLIGDSPSRIGFLTRIIQESPSGRLEPIPGMRGVAGVPEVYEVRYLGDRQPRQITLRLAQGKAACIDVIDTWQMTINTIHAVDQETVAVPLPGRPWMAIRIRYE